MSEPRAKRGEENIPEPKLPISRRHERRRALCAPSTLGEGPDQHRLNWFEELKAKAPAGKRCHAARDIGRAPCIAPLDGLALPARRHLRVNPFLTITPTIPMIM
jgi:hypothetical protein